MYQEKKRIDLELNQIQNEMMNENQNDEKKVEDREFECMDLFKCERV
jgi:hypothetical protein